MTLYDLTRLLVARGCPECPWLRIEPMSEMHGGRSDGAILTRPVFRFSAGGGCPIRFHPYLGAGDGADAAAAMWTAHALRWIRTVEHDAGNFWYEMQRIGEEGTEAQSLIGHGVSASALEAIESATRHLAT